MAGQFCLQSDLRISILLETNLVKYIVNGTENQLDFWCYKKQKIILAILLAVLRFEILCPWGQGFDSWCHRLFSF
jgi:hypothetical protein